MTTAYKGFDFMISAETFDSYPSIGEDIDVPVLSYFDLVLSDEEVNQVFKLLGLKFEEVTQFRIKNHKHHTANGAKIPVEVVAEGMAAAIKSANGGDREDETADFEFVAKSGQHKTKLYFGVNTDMWQGDEAKIGDRNMLHYSLFDV